MAEAIRNFLVELAGSLIKPGYRAGCRLEGAKCCASNTRTRNFEESRALFLICSTFQLFLWVNVGSGDNFAESIPARQGGVAQC
jgi:hypothetical protein